MEWRRIYGWDDYEVSEFGDIRCLRSNTRARGRNLAQRLGAKGRLMVTLWKDGRGACVTVANAICRGFHGSPPTPDHEAAHGDGDHTNNHYSNLRWATKAENMQDRELHGRTMRGAAHYGTNLCDADVLAIRHAHASDRKGKKCRAGVIDELAAKYKTTRCAVLSIVKRQSWNHI